MASLRAYEPVGDSAFVISTWIKSYRDAAAMRAVPTPVYNIGMRKRVDKILADPNTTCLIACDSDTPELIFGYIIKAAGNIVHYVYVKSQYRKLGTAHLLIHTLDWSQPIFYTHKSASFELERKFKEDRQLRTLIYNPFHLEG